VASDSEIITRHLVFVSAMNYLTKEDILDLHIYVVTTYGGLMGIASQDRLNTALNAPQQAMFGADLYPDLASKAAALLYMLIKSRPFIGANEGTGLLALLRFLHINGARLREEISSSELFWLIKSLNHSDMDKERLEEWLRENCEVVEERV
jgi:death-on-curing protein